MKTLNDNIKLIAETAWHHEGNEAFMNNLLTSIIEQTRSDILKMHVTIDLDEYMDTSHPAYPLLKPWMFTAEQWRYFIQRVKKSPKDLMLLFNDTKAIELGMEFDPGYVEIHSACLNDIRLQDALKSSLKPSTTLILGIGGTDLYEVDYALNRLQHPNTVLMFGFQNFPTRYEEVNFAKMRKIMGLYPEYTFGYADHTAAAESSNELITVLGAALGMRYIEKHVTTHYLEERVDWSAAISIDMFNSIADKLDLLNALQGDGQLKLNDGEQKYSTFGPSKKGAILTRDVTKGERFQADDFAFKRTAEQSDMSQLDVLTALGRSYGNTYPAGTILQTRHLS